jgi:hypothetical protein
VIIVMAPVRAGMPQEGAGWMRQIAVIVGGNLSLQSETGGCRAVFRQRCFWRRIAHALVVLLAKKYFAQTILGKRG